MAGTSDEMVKLMETGQYDGVSASGNATARLWAAGEVAPVNTALVPNYKTVFADLKGQPYNTFEGQAYGIPHGRGANLLMWNKDDVSPPPLLGSHPGPESGGQVQGPHHPVRRPDVDRRRRALPDEPRTDLGIENPYELNEEQFNAAVELMKEQKANVGEYWSSAEEQIAGFANGSNQVGTTWQYQYFALKGEKEPVEASPASQGFLPKEGATGLV